MGKEAVILILFVSVLLTSGCVSETDSVCEGVFCADKCIGDVRLHEGSCVSGECRYLAEKCAFGCEAGSCSDEGPGVDLSENPQEKGNFSVYISDTGIDLGEEYGNDDYHFTVEVTNLGPPGIFSIGECSLVAESGLMHGSRGFSWSDLLETGETGTVKLSIDEVPKSLREQRTTLLVRTNRGYFSFDAAFRG